MLSPNYREEAEKIVAEEKAHGEKMPVYEVRHCPFERASLVTSCKGLGGIQTCRKDGRRRFLQCVQGD